MSIVRAPRPESNYYVLSKAISEDARLSWAARGLLVYLLGKPDHWEISVESLRRQTEGARVRTGRDGVYALLGELEKAGYLVRQQQRRGGGQLDGVSYAVSEVASKEPLPDQPHAGQPYTANPTLVSNDFKQELKEANNPLPPSGGEDRDLHLHLHRSEAGKAAKPTRKVAELETAKFAEFYQVYPRHEARPDAAKAWRKNNCEAMADRIVAELKTRTAEDPQWSKERKRYIPLPATYLNGRRWEDQWRDGGDGGSAGLPDFMQGVR
ncbi:hypothetical protein HDC36_003414 [Xanthomonas sp. JAI131]|uniref:hypothetical protein n=1 Tax=Xanthomonas sp. JAI131 TaxID=2723067 RepID=UPI0015CD91C8|nr:hypothetical protein [Xanthomonas sp. JAI131]NYF21938.1 hypothetical protein [Xanthomonas sp. JAI131]